MTRSEPPQKKKRNLPEKHRVRQPDLACCLWLRRMRNRSDAAGAGTEASGESRAEQSDIYGKLLDSGTVACESAGEEIPTGGVESDHRW
ncbi:hypothetical protein ACFX1R_006092 [Malus domestica]